MKNKKISILGYPVDQNSSFLKGASHAPPIIMEAFNSESSNTFSENGIDLGEKNLWTFINNQNIPSKEKGFEFIRNSIDIELHQKFKCISIGGDHSITYPIISAYNRYYKNINILHFDAHPDLYNNYDNNPYSHASPFRRILEKKLSNNLIQIGIRTMNNHQKQQVKKFNVTVIDMNTFTSNIKLQFNGPVYVSIDLDGLDPAFAPGVSHPEPGGLSTRDIIKVISNINTEIIGGDIVEYNPKRDVNQITAITAAKLLKELMGKMLK